MSPLRYELLKTDPATRARLGRVTTPHGVFDTPAFMPVGTQGTVKGILPTTSPPPARRSSSATPIT
jgi:queuine tRNA-ribosyltransferase